jgi:predicted nuclease of predicted toxin-antitoxin system
MNLSPRTVEALQRQGWDIVRVSDLLPVTASDEEILELAQREGRVIVTQDLDFSALLALGDYSRPSLITLRLSFTDPETVTCRLLDVVPGIEHRLREGLAVTIEDVSVRARRLPIT